MSLEALFCDIDDFCQDFLPQWEKEQLACGERKRRRPSHLSVSEIITIMVNFHQSQYRHFKNYYLLQVRGHLKGEFPELVSYQRFVALIPLSTHSLVRLS